MFEKMYDGSECIKCVFIESNSEFIDEHLSPPNQTAMDKIKSNWAETAWAKCSSKNYFWTEWRSASSPNDTDSDGNDYETLEMHRFLNPR